MDIGAIVVTSPAASKASNKTTSSQTQSEGFPKLFGSIMAENSETGSVVPTDKSLSDETLQSINKLIELLGKDDLLELEGGYELLNQILSSDESEIMTLLAAFIGEEVAFPEDTTNETLLSELMAYLTRILALPIEELSKQFNQEMNEQLSVLKLIELVGKNQVNTQEQTKLEELISQLKKQLEQLASQGMKEGITDTSKQQGRATYLQHTFSAVLAEMNSKPQVMKTTIDTQAKIEQLNGPVQFLQMSKPEQLTLMLEQASKPTSTADMIKQFENILARSQLSNVNGMQKLMIKLHPEHLGSLKIELIQRESGLIAKFITTTAMAKNALESQLNGLKQAFGLQNIQVDKIEISQQLTQQQDRFLNKDSEQQSHHNRDENAKQQNDDANTNEGSFSFSLEEALINTEA